MGSHSEASGARRVTLIQWTGVESGPGGGSASSVRGMDIAAMLDVGPVLPVMPTYKDGEKCRC